MVKERNWFLEYYVVAIIAIVFGIVFFIATRNPDIDLAKKVMYGLAQGKESVEDSLDWPTLKILDKEIGASYVKLQFDRERVYFRKLFIVNFSLSFQSVGGELRYFTNWRIYSRDKEKTIVAVDTLKKPILLFTISYKYGKRKIVAIQFKE